MDIPLTCVNIEQQVFKLRTNQSRIMEPKRITSLNQVNGILLFRCLLKQRTLDGKYFQIYIIVDLPNFSFVLFLHRGKKKIIFFQITPKLRLSLQALRRAFEKRDIEAFRKALNKLEDIESVDDNQTISLFEEVCQTTGCAAFISECLQFGCDVNKVSRKM